MIVGAKDAVSSMLETSTLLGFSCTVSGVYREWCDKQKPSSQRQSCGQKQLVDERDRRRRARIMQAKRRATNRQIMASRNAQLVDPCHGWANAADDHTGFHSYQLKTRRSGYSTQAITNTGQLRSGKTWSDESKFLLHHVGSRGRIWLKQHESLHPSCLVSTVQAGGSGVLVWGMFSWHTLT